MSYQDISIPDEKQEVRDLAILTGMVVTWAGQTTWDFQTALPVAYDLLDKTAAFLEEKKNG